MARGLAPGVRRPRRKAHRELTIRSIGRDVVEWDSLLRAAEEAGLGTQALHRHAAPP